MKNILFLAVLFSVNSFAEYGVSDGSAYVRAGEKNGADYSNYQEMIIEVPETDAGISGKPVVSYIPVTTTATTQEHTVLDPAKIPDATNWSNAFAEIALVVINTEGADYYLYGAVKKTSESIYKRFHQEVVVDTTNVYMQVFLSLEDMSSAAEVTMSATNQAKYEYDVVMFMSKDNLTQNSEVDSNYYTDGYYFEFHVSSYVPTGQMHINEIQKGDGRLKLIYMNGNQVANIASDERYKTLILERNSAVVSSGGEYYRNVSLVDSIIREQIGYTEEGDFYVKGLVNGKNYNFSMAQMSKYQFVSPFSNSLIQSPETIEAFLKKQACYLFSAGFKEEHYVLDLLRNFRDEVLLDFSLGRVFVDWYYKSAPEYALTIYNSKILGFIVRSIGYTFYAVINYFYIFIVVVLMGLSAICIRRRYL